MRLELSNLTYYFLTHNNNLRKTHMMEEFKTFNLVEVNPSTLLSEKQKSGASGVSRILDLACQTQDRTKPFKPFVILEDDIKKADDFPEHIEIPENTDILYIGLSSWGMTDKNYGINNSVCYTNIDDNIIRIYNMLSSHGFIICSLRGLLSVQKCMMEVFINSDPWDIFLARLQPHLNVYALKNPLVYQYGEIGGQEYYTKISYTTSDKHIPKEWIKHNISIITMH